MKYQERIDNNDDKIEPMEYMDKYKLNDEYKYYENIGKRQLKMEN